MSKSKILFKFATPVGALYIKSTPVRGVYFTQVGDVMPTGKNSLDETLYFTELFATHKMLNLCFINSGGASREIEINVTKVLPFQTVDEYNKHMALDIVSYGGGLDVSRIPYKDLSYEYEEGTMHFKREMYMEELILSGISLKPWLL